MRVARISRGHDPRWIWQVKALASSAGALFIRSFERGERVHVAMLARGYDGVLPVVDDETGAPRSWPLALSLPAVADRRGPRRVGRAMSTPVLAVEGLAYAYPDGRQVLFGVDLTVHEGERVAILGPNGAGKTTLVLHLNGTLQAGAGRVSVDGLPVVKEHLKEIRRRVGIVFQDPDDQLFMPTVRDDVAFGPANLGYRGPELDERVARALRAVGCEDLADRPPHHLSFGQRRRVAAATVLVDGPCASWCSTSRRRTSIRWLGGSSPRSCSSLGLTTLMVTHDLPYALQLCPRAVVMTDGVIVADGPTREILGDEELMRANRLELPFGFALPEVAPASPR